MRVRVAQGEAARLRGFLGRTEIGEDEILLFENTRLLHTFGMRTHIDIVFVDKGMRIVRVFSNAGPWRIYGSLSATHALEFAPGSVARRNLVLGDLLTLELENVVG